MERMIFTEKEGPERTILIKSWQNAFKRATDFDAWGQPIEAHDIYQRLSKQLQVHANNEDTSLFPSSQKKVLEKISLCLDARRRCLDIRIKDSSQVESISLTDLKLLESTLENIYYGPIDSFDENQRFPIDVSKASAHSNSLSPTGDSQQDISNCEGEGSLLPKPLPVSGKTHLTVSIDHIGVKDSSHFLDPVISVSVRSQSGQALTSIQVTPAASRKTDSAITFCTDVHIEKSLESLPHGFAIFFEFRHFKPKKNSLSTYCWAFLEHDEVREGPIALELYKKPTDYQRKSLKLLTVKPLFLHLCLKLYD